MKTMKAKAQPVHLWQYLVQLFCGSNKERRQEMEWILTHCYFANMGGFYLYKGNSLQEAIPLTTTELAKWNFQNLPQLLEEDINDKSKSDVFTKAIAVMQISSLVISVIIRAVRYLAFPSWRC
jgi:hypothetical protein